MDSKGFDELLVTEHFTRPCKVRHLSAQSEWRRWQVAFGCAWSKEAHINELEVRAVLLDLQRWTRKASEIGSRYLVLTDSYVALGVLAKKRSSSRQLHRVLRRFDALELASGCKPYFGYIRSAKNPADRPSRRPAARKYRKFQTLARKRRRQDAGPSN